MWSGPYFLHCINNITIAQNYVTYPNSQNDEQKLQKSFQLPVVSSFYPSGSHTGLDSAHLSLCKIIQDPNEVLFPYTASFRAYPITKCVIKYFLLIHLNQ